MPTTLDIPPPTHREVTPVRTCASCGAYLRTGNLSTHCTPCGTPPWEILDLSDEDLIAKIAAIPQMERRREAFEALMRIQEEMEGAA